MRDELLLKRDFHQIAELAFEARQIQSVSEIPALMQRLSSFVPHAYSAVGHFSLNQQDQSGLGHSSYNQEFCSLYMSQGLLSDPSVIQLATTRVGQASSEDDPTIIEPRSLVSLKLDFGIQTCHSVAVRGKEASSLYISFSNFDRRQHARLAVIMEVVAPHLFLAYMHAHAKWKELDSMRSAPALTPREREILSWAAEGKTNWEISLILHVSLNTIKFHMKNIFWKLQVENRWAAVAYWQSISSHLFFERESSTTSDSSSSSFPS